MIELNLRKFGKYSFISTLGNGAEGVVYKVSYKKEFFALKRLNIILKPEIFEIYAKIAQNQNLVSFIEQFTFNGDTCLIFEFCNQGSLKTLNYHSEEQIIKILRDICNGYKELYKNCIIHRDIKPDNILCHNQVYKIADFGFARFVLNPQLFQDLTKLGTPIYTAPQLIEGCQFSSKCDVWSLGLVLYELIYQKKLMGECRSYDEIKEIQQQIKTGKLIYPETHIKNKQLINLVKSMIQYSESDRICWDTIFSHQIITDFKIMMEPIEDADQLEGKYFFLLQIAKMQIFEDIFETLQDSRDILYLLQIWFNYLNVLNGQLLGQIVIKTLVISQACKNPYIVVFIKTDLGKNFQIHINSMLEFLKMELRSYLFFEQQKHSMIHKIIKTEQIEFFENTKIIKLINTLRDNQREMLHTLIQDQLIMQ